MRIAIVGGTGPFGVALATRLREAAYDVVLGSRDAARAKAAAAELGVEGATNAEAVRDADLVVLATNAEAVLDTAQLLRADIGSTPILCVASELRFTPSGVLPSPEAASLAERVQAHLDTPVVAGLHSLAASTLGKDEPHDVDAFVCVDDHDVKTRVLEVAGRLIDGRAF
ncbi:MAG: NAD(P)-binding domain-containing protein, partial [Actinobacteria bacterium]|nr:NAD(P)-binding domain-containing protein [Actinomycetota bacterium]